MARRVRGLQGDPAIPRAQRRHDARRVQDDLLVGMDPPAARAGDRGCVSAAISLVSLARSFERGSQTPLVADLWSRRAARRGRLVDGGIGAFGARRGFALSAMPPSYCW